MFRKCLYCNKEFKLINNKHISQKVKKFCCKAHKDLWSQKYSIVRHQSKLRADRKWRMNNKEKRHLYFKSHYIPHPKILLTEEEKKLKDRIWNRNYKYRLRKLNKKLELKTVQLVYEDNIKKYGTLTCIYCLQSIEFGKDTLEHKIPLSRSGTNEYDNLAIACSYCNNKKNRKTLEEFKERIKCEDFSYTP